MLKTKIKSLISITLSVTLLFSILSIDAFANSDAALEESLNTQLKNFNDTVDIYNFKIPYTDENIQKISNILYGVLPECFHIEDFSISHTNEYISKIYPSYSCTKAEYDLMLAECEAAADKMLEGVEGNANLSDKEKLLIIHDRIAISCEYDYESYLMGNTPQNSYTIYGVLVKNRAVCQGYALAYSYLLDRIGIENYYCSSDALNHVWNIVYLDGKPYHVDITYDDPVWDVTGKVLHTNFLVSTDELRQNKHNADDFDSSPSDTTYDDYFWQNIESAFVYLNGEIYYTELEDGEYVTIKRYSDKQTLYKTKHYWRVGQYGYYPGDYSKLAVCGSKILFSLSDGIYSLNPNTKEVKMILSNPQASNYYNIYGFTYANGQLIYDVTPTPNFDANTKKNYEYKVEYHDPGNLNDDGNIDLLDVTLLAEFLADWQGVKVNSKTLDISGDGVTNLFDLVRLSQYVAGWNVEIY